MYWTVFGLIGRPFVTVRARASSFRFGVFRRLHEGIQGVTRGGRRSFWRCRCAAFAQASLAGLVRDASGAVLPGVTVEASSPVLIEKLRSTVTDGTGRYTIPDLRPGTYRVTFTLPGFRTVVREGVELSGTAVFTINADMTVGGLQETITVSGETPVVDLQSTTRQAVMDQEVVTAIPSSRTPFTTGVLIPGVRKGAFTGQDVGGSVVQEVASLEANGGRTSDQRMMVNGVALSSGIAGGWGGGAVPNATGTAEFAIDVSGVDAQAATGGVRINFIPRDGGNRFSGTVFGSYATGRLGSRQLHRHRRPAGRTGGPGNDQGERRPQSGLWRTDQARQALVLPVRAPTLRRQLRGQHVLQREREQAGPLRLRAIAEPGGPPSGADHLPGSRDVAGESQAQDRHNFRPGELLRLHDRHWPGPRRYHLARGRQRPPFPAAAFRHRGLEHAGQQQAAGRSQRHPPRRTVGRHGAAGGQAGQHRSPGAGHDLGHRHPQPGHRHAADVSCGRDLQQLLELESPLPGGGVLHHRIPCLQGGLQQRLPASRQHDLQCTGDAVQLQLHLDGAHRDHLPNRAPHGRSQRQSRHGTLCPGQVDHRTVDAGGRPPLRLLQEQLPGAVGRGHVLRPKPEHPVRQDRQPELERRDAAARRHLRCLRQWQDGVQGDAQQVPGGPGDHRIRAGAGIGRAESGQSAAEHDTARLGGCRPRLRPGLRSEQLRGRTASAWRSTTRRSSVR